MTDSNPKASIKGDYKKIPGTNFYINYDGFIKDTLGRMKYPYKRGNKIHYRIGPNTSNWPVNVSRTRLLNNVWSQGLTRSDLNLYDTIRTSVRNYNQTHGFEHKSSSRYEKERQQKRYDEDETSKKRAKTERPCKDGRAKDCYGYLPKGYYLRCPNCWRDLQQDSGYCQFDYPGRMVWHN